MSNPHIIDQQDVAVFVHHHPYYLESWKQKKIGMNWVAFFFPGIWFFNRKMYLWGMYFYLIIILNAIVVGLFAAYFEVEINGILEFVLLSLIPKIVIGLFANIIYYVHTIKKIKQVSHIEEQELREQKLHQMGGESKLAAFSALLFQLFLIMNSM